MAGLVSEWGLINVQPGDDFYDLHSPNNSVKALKDNMVCWHIKDQLRENWFEKKVKLRK